MASPIVTPLPVHRDTDYRPLSAMAIIGFILSLFTVLLFYLNQPHWILFFCTIPAFILSTIAYRAVNASGGQLVGGSAALMGIIISVAGGLGWMTSQAVAKLVTDHEARQAVDAWFEHLRRGESGHAFLYTQQPKLRAVNFHPEDLRRLRLNFPAGRGGGNLYDDYFLKNPFYELFIRYGSQLETAFVSQLDSMQTGDVYGFRFRYLVKTPSAEANVVFIASSEITDTAHGRRRDWSVSIDKNASSLVGTPYGLELSTATGHAYNPLQIFMNAVANDEGSLVDQVLDPKLSTESEYHQLIGYLRGDKPKGTVLIELKTFRLIKDRKVGEDWVLAFNCRATTDYVRDIDFNITLLGHGKDWKGWKVTQCQFNGTRRNEGVRKVMTPLG